MKRSFYSSIADYYDYIFPYNPLQIKFINHYAENTFQQNILEIGCGTGNLTFGLSKLFKTIYGIDLDTEMLAKADEKNIFTNTHFSHLNMLNLNQGFKPHSINNMVCFGNTLVHLNGEAEIEHFIQSTKELLTDEGNLFLQIINYDRILNQQINALPTIENDYIEFIREYEYLQQKHLIDFKTTLKLKQSGEIIQNTQMLYPIRKAELEDILSKYYSKVKCFGSFNEDEWSLKTQALIIHAK